MVRTAALLVFGTIEALLRLVALVLLIVSMLGIVLLLTDYDEESTDAVVKLLTPSLWEKL